MAVATRLTEGLWTHEVCRPPQWVSESLTVWIWVQLDISSRPCKGLETARAAAAALLHTSCAAAAALRHTSRAAAAELQHTSRAAAAALLHTSRGFSTCSGANPMQTVVAVTLNLKQHSGRAGLLQWTVRM